MEHFPWAASFPRKLDYAKATELELVLNFLDFQTHFLVENHLNLFNQNLNGQILTHRKFLNHKNFCFIPGIRNMKSHSFQKNRQMVKFLKFTILRNYRLEFFQKNSIDRLRITKKILSLIFCIAT